MDDGQDLRSLEREGRLRAFGSLALVLACVLGLGYVAWRVMGGGPGATAPGGDVSQVRMRDAQGRVATLASLRGKVVVLDVWATWCPPCRASLPEVAALQKAADDRYVVVALSVDEGGFSDVQPFLAQRPELGLRAVVPEGTDALAPLGEIRGIPTTFVIDRSGKVAARWSGYYPGRAEAELRKVLGA